MSILLNEALKSPVVRDAAMKKLALPEQPVPAASSSTAPESETYIPENIAAGREALLNRDYNEAMRKFRAALDQDAGFFLMDKDLLSDLGKAFQFASLPNGNAATGAELFLGWEKEMREGTALWAMPSAYIDEQRYLLLYYAGRMRRQRAVQLAKQPSRQQREYDEAKILFTSALNIAPDEIQADACIWYIFDLIAAKNGEKTEETSAAIKKYAPVWHDPAYFSDFFEEFTHLLCLNRKWDEIAELFPYIHRYGGPELSAKYAFILANALELGFLTQDKAAAALGSRISGLPDMNPVYSDASGMPEPADFYQIVYDSNIIGGLDASSFYYVVAAAKKLGKKPSLNIPDTKTSVNSYAGKTGIETDEPPLVKKFLTGFFIFGAERFAYPYIIDNDSALSIPDLRELAKSLRDAGRWGEAIRIARTYMQRPGYKPEFDDIKICYPFAYGDLVAEFSNNTGMDENLLYGLIRTESLFISDIVSRAGAVGLTQLMPETARETARQLARAGGIDYINDDSLDLANPSLNIHLGALYFQQLKSRLNSTLLALLSYNGGINRIRRWKRARPTLNDALFLESVEYAETRSYGRQVFTAAAIYRILRTLQD
jgi:soluble lytic murein transglycosylase